MASIGKFGVERVAEVVNDTTFEYFESVIHLSPLSFNELEFVDLMETAGQVDENNPAAVTLIKDMFRLVLAPELDENGDPIADYVGSGFDTFWALAKRNRQGIEDLMPVYQALMEAQAQRPTQRPSDSSDGPPTTPPSSPVDSSSDPESDGRPDLLALKAGSAETRARLALAGAAG